MNRRAETCTSIAFAPEEVKRLHDATSRTTRLQGARRLQSPYVTVRVRDRVAGAGGGESTLASLDRIPD
jgi:hypothetical protein